MNHTVREVMTANPMSVDVAEPVSGVAALMRDQDVGAVLVVDKAELRGIVTDRDLAVRVIAERKDPQNTTAGDIASKELVAVSPDDPADQVIALMRLRSVRRVPVVEDGKPVGILSIGDLAMDFDPTSVLSDISMAPANR
jgi:CBS domain-containing protein